MLRQFREHNKGFFSLDYSGESLARFYAGYYGDRLQASRERYDWGWREVSCGIGITAVATVAGVLYSRFDENFKRALNPVKPVTPVGVFAEPPFAAPEFALPLPAEELLVKYGPGRTGAVAVAAAAKTSSR